MNTLNHVPTTLNHIPNTLNHIRRIPTPRPAPESVHVTLADPADPRPRTMGERDLVEMSGWHPEWPETPSAWLDSVITGYVDEHGMAAERVGLLMGAPVEAIEAACDRSRGLRTRVLRHVTRRLTRPATA